MQMRAQFGSGEEKMLSDNAIEQGSRGPTRSGTECLVVSTEEAYDRDCGNRKVTLRAGKPEGAGYHKLGTNAFSSRRRESGGRGL